MILKPIKTPDSGDWMFMLNSLLLVLGIFGIAFAVARLLSEGTLF